MQIGLNTTGMLAELAITTDMDARDHCVVAVKGTFKTDESGVMSITDEQRPLVTADEHYGDPATTSVRYECDFAPQKPLTDVIVVGKAVAPKGQRVQKLTVALEVQGTRKELIVYGERRWVTALGLLSPSSATTFSEMPITFERAWGEQGDSRGPGKIEVEPCNLVGQGFHPYRPSSQVAGLPVSNVEVGGEAVTSPRARHEPAGFGCIGRSWHPRIKLAGSYDDKWRDERAPFLPVDFDPRYFQAAPADQQFPHFQGGEKLRCVHMADREVVSYVMPTLGVAVCFRFTDEDAERKAVLDTVTLEPHLGLAMLVYRASIPLRKKLTTLREVQVGVPAAPQSAEREILGYRNGKPIFPGIASTLRWLRGRGRGGER